MSKKLYSGSDDYYTIKDAIKEIYEMPAGEDREREVKHMRSQLYKEYGDDPEATYIRDHDLKYF